MLATVYEACWQVLAVAGTLLLVVGSIGMMAVIVFGIGTLVRLWRER